MDDDLSLISQLVAWLHRTCYIHLCHDHSSMKVVYLKKKLLKAQSFQGKPGFVYWSLDNVCIFIEWVQLASHSHSANRGGYKKKVLLLERFSHDLEKRFR